MYSSTVLITQFLTLLTHSIHLCTSQLLPLYHTLLYQPASQLLPPLPHSIYLLHKSSPFYHTLSNYFTIPPLSTTLYWTVSIYFTATPPSTTLYCTSIYSTVPTSQLLPLLPYNVHYMYSTVQYDKLQNPQITII